VITGAVNRRAGELASRGEAFVTATVVRVERPTSVQPGNVALIREDGTIEGFVGGVCAQHSVRVYSLKAIEQGEPVLLRIVPDGPPLGAHEDLGGREAMVQEGTVTVHNPCLSGGSIEVFLEPFLPAPRVVVAGESPIALALARIGPEIGLDVVTTLDEGAAKVAPDASDLALIVAAHGRDEVEILRAGLEAGVEYVGLVASRKRGAAVIEELRADGVPEQLLNAIDSPAGLDIGAKSPAEVALSILAQVIAVRRRGEGHAGGRPQAVASTTALDPICGMTVVAGASTLSYEHEGTTHYFCCEGCLRTFESEHASAAG
jgi:xanthine dehydrogenase accessory factor